MVFTHSEALQLWMCYLGDVSLRCEADHDVQLLQLHIDWVIVLHKENLHLVFQDLWAKHLNSSLLFVENVPCRSKTLLSLCYDIPKV